MPEAFVRGIRDLGYRRNGDAVAELIDNALQANAERVDVLFGHGEAATARKPLRLAVVDDGHGMGAAMIRMAVMWGGTHRENDRSGLGRYGYGLPCSAVSLGRRFTVLSQVSGGALKGVTLDLDALIAGEYTDAGGDIVIPEATRAELPPFVAEHIVAAYPGGWQSGTIVLIEKLDRLEWATAQGLRDNLCRRFGVTYHKLRGEAALYVDGVHVRPIDPLFLTPEFHLHDLDEDRAQPFDPIGVEVRNPETGVRMGAITLRYAWLPPSAAFAREAQLRADYEAHREVGGQVRPHRGGVKRAASDSDWRAASSCDPQWPVRIRPCPGPYSGTIRARDSIFRVREAAPEERSRPS